MPPHPLCAPSILTHRAQLHLIAVQAQCRCKTTLALARAHHVQQSAVSPCSPSARLSSSSCARASMESGPLLPHSRPAAMPTVLRRSKYWRQANRRSQRVLDAAEQEKSAMMERLWADTVGKSEEVRWADAGVRLRAALESAAAESLRTALDQELSRPLPKVTPWSSHTYLFEGASEAASTSARISIHSLHKSMLLLTSIMDAAHSNGQNPPSAGTYIRAAIRLASVGSRTLLVEPSLEVGSSREAAKALRVACASSIRSYMNVARPLLQSVSSSSSLQPDGIDVSWAHMSSLEVEALVLEGRIDEARSLLSDILHAHADLLSTAKEHLRQPGAKGLSIPHRRLLALNDAVTAVLRHDCSKSQTRRFAGRRKSSKNEVEGHPSAAIAASSHAERGLRWILQQSHALSFVTGTMWRSFAPFCELVAQIDQPEQLVREILAGHRAGERANSQRLGAFLLGMAAHGRQGATEAASLWLMAAEDGNIVSENDTVSLVRHLDNSLRHSIAYSIVDKFLAQHSHGHSRQLTRRSLTILANLFSRRGDGERMHVYLDALAERYSEDPSISRHRRMCLLQAAEFSGDTESCRELCAQLLSAGLPAEVVECATLTRLARTHLRKGEVAEAAALRDELLDGGASPSASFLELFVIAFCNTGDAESAASAVNTLRLHGHSLSLPGYVALIRLYAQRRETENATHTFETMLRAGIQPSRQSINTLFNAYIEAGSWRAATSLFRWADSQLHRHLRPDSHMCGLVLKAMVLTRSPVQDVLGVYMQMREKQILPGSLTYLLLLQSACDAGKMHIAESIFSVTEERLGGQSRQRRKSPVVLFAKPGEGADTFHFSVMIHAYLRLGRSSDALEYFKEMRRRKLEPTFVTYAAIIQAYVNSGVEENIEVAEELATKVIAGTELGENIEEDPLGIFAETPSRLSRDDVLAHHAEALLFPIMHARALGGDKDNALTIFRRLVSLGARLSIRAFSALLLAYRGTADIEGALEVWKVLYSEALREVRAGAGIFSADAGAIPPSKRNFICTPLSIMIDTLSIAGSHGEVAQLWAQVRADGFGFDSHNFNALAQAMLRAGRVEDCMRVIQNVLNSPSPAAQHGARDVPNVADATLSQRSSDADGSALMTDDRIDPDPTSYFAEDAGASGSSERLPHHAMAVDFVRSPARPPNRRWTQRGGKDSDDLPSADELDLTVEERQLQAQEALESVELALEEAYEQVVEDPDEIARLRFKQEGLQRAVKSNNEDSYESLDSKAGEPDLLHKFELNRERELSDWFAHHETLSMLDSALTRLQQGQAVGLAAADTGSVDDGSAFVERRQLYNRLRSEYPRAREILEAHQHNETHREADRGARRPKVSL